MAQGFLAYTIEACVHKSIVTLSRLFDEKKSLYGVDEVEEEGEWLFGAELNAFKIRQNIINEK